MWPGGSAPNGRPQRPQKVLVAERAGVPQDRQAVRIVTSCLGIDDVGGGSQRIATIVPGGHHPAGPRGQDFRRRQPRARLSWPQIQAGRQASAAPRMRRGAAQAWR